MPRPTGTLQQQRRAKHEHERALLAVDLCKKCGISPRGTNADGTRSQRCDPCKPNRSASIKSSASRTLKRPKPAGDEWGIEEDHGYIDSPAYHAYSERLRKLITRSPSPMTMAETKRAMGDDLKVHWHADALTRISDTIEAYVSGEFTRYRPIASRVEAGKGWNKQLRWNNNQRPVTGSKTYPFALMDDTRRRELA